MNTRLELAHIPLAQDVSRVTVPVDFSSAARRALGVGAMLAHRMHVPLRIVHVQPSGTPAAEVSRAKLMLYDVGHSVADAYLGVPEPDIHVLCDDDVAHAIADDDHAAVVVIGSDSVSRRASLKGSRADSVVAFARHQPVVIVGPAAKLNGQAGPLAVFLDGSPIAEAALPAAVAWANRFERPIALVQVVDAATASYAKRDGDGVRSSYLLAVQHALENEGTAARADLVVHDDPAAAIVRYLAERDCPFGFISTHASQGVEREAFGSTAMAVAARSTCPIAVVRPTRISPPILPLA